MYAIRSYYDQHNNSNSSGNSQFHSRQLHNNSARLHLDSHSLSMLLQRMTMTLSLFRITGRESGLTFV